MTRKEQIEKRIESGELQFLNEQCKRSFLGGAEWADDNPKPDKRDEIIKIMREAAIRVIRSALDAGLAMPKVKLVSMELSDFKALRELGKSISELDQALAAVEKLESEN